MRLSHRLQVKCPLWSERLAGVGDLWLLHRCDVNVFSTSSRCLTITPLDKPASTLKLYASLRRPLSPHHPHSGRPTLALPSPG